MSMPPCYYPTTVVFVDDEGDNFLSEITPWVCPPNSHTKTFDRPEGALTFINQRSENRFSRAFRNKVQNAQFNRDWLEWGIFDLRKIANDKTKSNDVSVVVLDYDMPGMNGIELASRIIDPNIKCILLTGVADERIAVEALEKKHICGYVRKDDQKIFDKLKALIYRLQLDYFEDVFGRVGSMLELCPNNGADNPFFTKAYNEILKKAIDEIQATEYYLSENSGSVRLLDKYGHSYSVLIRTHDDVDAIRNESMFEALSKEQKTAIQNQEAILCLDWMDKKFEDCSEWTKRIKPSKKVSYSNSEFSWILAPEVLIQTSGEYVSDTHTG